MGKIVHRYIFREILLPFVLGLSVFTFILLLARLLRLTELVVNRGVPASTIAQLLTFIMPAFLEVTVPMAMLLAILVAFGRLSTDSELVAMRSCGLSLYQLLRPVAVVAIVSTIATVGLSVYARPWGNRSLRSALFDIARTRASAGIRPHVFNADFPGLVIYTERIDPTTDLLYNVLIADDRDETEHNRIFARRARMVSDPERETVTLRLREGFIHTTDGARGVQYETDFQTYEVNLDLRAALAAGEQRQHIPKELTLSELRSAMVAKRSAGLPFGAELVEYHRKFSIPFACIVFALVGVPLGIQPARSARAWGFAVSLVTIFCYYVLLSAGQAAAEQGLVPAVVGLWLPNLLFAVVGVRMLVRVGREEPMLGTERLAGVIGALRARLGARLGIEPTA